MEQGARGWSKGMWRAEDLEQGMEQGARSGKRGTCREEEQVEGSSMELEAK
jgi:hypothetical protein